MSNKFDTNRFEWHSNKIHQAQFPKNNYEKQSFLDDGNSDFISCVTISVTHGTVFINILALCLRF